MIPNTNPTTPITAIKGVGKGRLITSPKGDNFTPIKAMKTSDRIAATLPETDLEIN